MYINIITPCSRPENLKKISESISIPCKNYRWIVVCDSEKLPENSLIPDNCEIYIHQHEQSVSGNAQRNFAMDKVSKGYLYFNDDDTLIHPELWDNIKNLNSDFIHFQQSFENGQLRLTAEKVEGGHIDSHNFIASFDIAKDIRWVLDLYWADALFAINCYNNSQNYTRIDKVLSVYNQLRGQ